MSRSCSRFGQPVEDAAAAAACAARHAQHVLQRRIGAARSARRVRASSHHGGQLVEGFEAGQRLDVVHRSFPARCAFVAAHCGSLAELAPDAPRCRLSLRSDGRLHLIATRSMVFLEVALVAVAARAHHCRSPSSSRPGFSSSRLPAPRPGCGVRRCRALRCSAGSTFASRRLRGCARRRRRRSRARAWWPGTTVIGRAFDDACNRFSLALPLVVRAGRCRAPGCPGQLVDRLGFLGLGLAEPGPARRASASRCMRGHERPA